MTRLRPPRASVRWNRAVDRPDAEQVVDNGGRAPRRVEAFGADDVAEVTHSGCRFEFVSVREAVSGACPCSRYRGGCRNSALGLREAAPVRERDHFALALRQPRAPGAPAR